METYWCTKKNSLFETRKDAVNFNTALIRCLMSECDTWKEGECVHIRKSRKTGSSTGLQQK